MAKTVPQHPRDRETTLDIIHDEVSRNFSPDNDKY